MRHYLLSALPPAPLARRMAASTPVARLVSRAGPSQRLAPAKPRTSSRAIAIAAIAASADAYLYRAARAAIEPIAPFARLLHAPLAIDDWTTPPIAGIKAERRAFMR